MNSPLANIIEQAKQVIVGKQEAIELALTCFLARGHLLIEDIPGVGKTTFSHTLARCLGLGFKRVQFTSDLLPADIIGMNVFDPQHNHFHFHPGPLFTQMLLADEINRSSPKTQSALLEAMEEGQVTVEGQTHDLPGPFLVIATQNPLEQVGTYPLPESQLDRFLMRIQLGYPGAEAERRLLKGHDRQALIRAIEPQTKPGVLREWQQQVEAMYVDDVIYDYVQALVQHSRSALFLCGLSPRAAMALLKCAKARAWIQGRQHVLPDDVQYVLAPVANHRIRFATPEKTLATAPADELLKQVAVP